MLDEAGTGTLALDGHQQRRGRQLGPETVAHGATRDLARVQFHDGGHVEPTLTRGSSRHCSIGANFRAGAWDRPVMAASDAATSPLLLETQWSALTTAVSTAIDLEATARTSGALVRRRGIRSAETLLRLALAYSPGSLLLRTAVAWAGVSGMAN